MWLEPLSFRGSPTPGSSPSSSQRGVRRLHHLIGWQIAHVMVRLLRPSVSLDDSLLSSPVTASPTALPSGAVPSFRAINRASDALGRSRGVLSGRSSSSCQQLRSAGRVVIHEEGHPAWLKELGVGVFAPLPTAQKTGAVPCCPSPRLAPRQAFPSPEEEAQGAAPALISLPQSSFTPCCFSLQYDGRKVVSACTPGSLCWKGPGVESVPSSAYPVQQTPHSSPSVTDSF